MISLFELIRSLYDLQVSPNVAAQKQHQDTTINSCKKALMLVASNLETVKSSLNKEKSFINQFGETVKQTDFFSKLNQSLENTDRANSRMILEMYFNLYESDPETFSKENTSNYTLAPLSSIMATEIQSLSHDKVLVSLYLLFLTSFTPYRPVSTCLSPTKTYSLSAKISFKSSIVDTLIERLWRS